MTSILILCTGNSCRSQMAEAFLKDLNQELNVFSAGSEPAPSVHPMAIRVMKEAGIDISENRPKDVNQFLDRSFDFVITVCDHAKETCPVFLGDVKKRLHFGFEDPAEATGSEKDILQVFRRVRDEIKDTFTKFYKENIISNRNS